MKHGRWMIVAALAIAIGVAVPAAGAGSNTSVTIKSHTLDGFLDGKVKSSKAKCEAERRVKFYGDEPGRPRDFEKLAEDVSGENGRWVVDAPSPLVPPGHYFVKVTKDGGCDKAQSETIKVKPVPE